MDSALFPFCSPPRLVPNAAGRVVVHAAGGHHILLRGFALIRNLRWAHHQQICHVALEVKQLREDGWELWTTGYGINPQTSEGSPCLTLQWLPLALPVTRPEQATPHLVLLDGGPEDGAQLLERPPRPQPEGRTAAGDVHRHLAVHTVGLFLLRELLMQRFVLWQGNHMPQRHACTRAAFHFLAKGPAPRRVFSGKPSRRRTLQMVISRRVWLRVRASSLCRNEVSRNPFGFSFWILQR